MRNRWMQLLLAGSLAVGTASVFAQGPGHDGPPPPFGGPMEFMGLEGMHGGKVVKGAPFSAVSTSETSQTLHDGTVIHRTTQGNIYRDSQGRSRHELTFNGVGALPANGTPHKMVAIADPVAGLHYMLNEEKKTAHKMAFKGHGGTPETGDNAEAFHQKMQAREQAEIASGALKKESLGTQMINGVNAEGTRTTRTIAAGQIGNDKPIQVVSERWYSPELQTVVKSSRTDPRFGTTTFALTNIQRSEPAASLFAVPSDFTVKEGGPGHRHHGPGPGAPAAPVTEN